MRPYPMLSVSAGIMILTMFIIGCGTFQGEKDSRFFELSQREIDLLRLFADHPGEVLHRFNILDKVWGISYEGTTRTLDQHIAKLRRRSKTIRRSLN